MKIVILKTRRKDKLVTLTVEKCPLLPIAGALGAFGGFYHPTPSIQLHPIPNLNKKGKMCKTVSLANLRGNHWVKLRFDNTWTTTTEVISAKGLSGRNAYNRTQSDKNSIPTAATPQAPAPSWQLWRYKTFHEWRGYHYGRHKDEYHMNQRELKSSLLIISPLFLTTKTYFTSLNDYDL